MADCLETQIDLPNTEELHRSQELEQTKVFPPTDAPSLPVQPIQQGKSTFYVSSEIYHIRKDGLKNYEIVSDVVLFESSKASDGEQSVETNSETASSHFTQHSLHTIIDKSSYNRVSISDDEIGHKSVVMEKMEAIEELISNMGLPADLQKQSRTKYDECVSKLIFPPLDEFRRNLLSLIKDEEKKQKKEKEKKNLNNEDNAVKEKKDEFENLLAELVENCEKQKALKKEESKEIDIKDVENHEREMLNLKNEEIAKFEKRRMENYEKRKEEEERMVQLSEKKVQEKEEDLRILKETTRISNENTERQHEEFERKKKEQREEFEEKFRKIQEERERKREQYKKEYEEAMEKSRQCIEVFIKCLIMKNRFEGKQQECEEYLSSIRRSLARVLIEYQNYKDDVHQFQRGNAPEMEDFEKDQLEYQFICLYKVIVEVHSSICNEFEFMGSLVAENDRPFLRVIQKKLGQIGTQIADIVELYFNSDNFIISKQSDDAFIQLSRNSVPTTRELIELVKNPCEYQNIQPPKELKSHVNIEEQK